MAHPRSTIRKKFVSLLSGETDAGTRVHDSRTQPVATLPAIRVYAREDSFIEWRSLGSSAHRMVSVAVECLVSGNNEADTTDACDTLCRQVEQTLDDYPDVDGTALLRVYNSTDFDTNGDVDPPVIVGTVTFDVEYLDDFS